MGFAFSAIPAIILFSCFGTNLYNDGEEIPRWFYFLQAVSYFMYRMLDEMDGKQARRTGNSSPLGLLFDHGCDAFSTGILCLVIAKCMQTGNSVAMDLLLIATLSSFHFCTLEEYYTGGLFLPPFNAISDGSFAFISLFIYCGLFGNEWSQEIVYKEVRFVDVFVYVAIFVNTFIVIMNIKGIFTHQKKKINYDPITNTGDITGEILVVKDLAGQIIGYVLPMSLLFGIYVLTSRSFEVMVL